MKNRNDTDANEFNPVVISPATIGNGVTFRELLDFHHQWTPEVVNKTEHVQVYGEQLGSCAFLLVPNASANSDLPVISNHKHNVSFPKIACKKGHSPALLPSWTLVAVIVGFSSFIHFK